MVFSLEIPYLSSGTALGLFVLTMKIVVISYSFVRGYLWS